MNRDQPPPAPPEPAAVAALFAAAGEPLAVTPHGRGLINDSYLVQQRHGAPFLLQRLNPAVFPHPEAVMHNLRLVSRHLQRQNSREEGAGRPAITLLPTRQLADCHYDEQGACWRALEFIENSRTIASIEQPEQAFEAGTALGRFHRRLADLPPAELNDLLPAFHITPAVLADYQQEAAAATGPVPSRQRFCRQFIDRRRPGAARLEQARARGILIEQVIHGDPKLDNILFDREGGRSLALIDLDTVKPGLIHYDIGDCLRSCCNRAGEESDNPAATFELELARPLLAGYLQQMRRRLTSGDLAYLYEAARLITFELGVRFFRDYLAGNRYFKVSDPEQNLRRALNQFRLVESIEQQEGRLREIINELSRVDYACGD